VKDEDTSNWGPHRTSVNDEFEAKLASNLHLKFLYVLFAMGIIGSRHGQAILRGCIIMTESGIT
jgi:hypothetical protein